MRLNTAMRHAFRVAEEGLRMSGQSLAPPTDPAPSLGTSPPDADGDDVEHVRLAYGAAIDLWAYEGDTIWSKFNAMLVANSVVLATSGVAATAAQPSLFLTVSLTVAGLVLCGLWLALTKRGYEYQRYWVLSARELEERHFAPAATLVARGGLYADGQPVDLTIGGRTRTLRMSALSRRFKTAWNSYLIVATFGVLYLLFLVNTLVSK